MLVVEHNVDGLPPNVHRECAFILKLYFNSGSMSTNYVDFRLAF